MKRVPTACGLLLINLGVFLATVAFLPEGGSFSFSGPLEYFVNIRSRWDIAWCVLGATTALLVGVFQLMAASGAFAGRPELGE